MEIVKQTLVKELKHYFGYEQFMNADQEEATTEVFKACPLQSLDVYLGKNDVLINLQPGAGKSICFQLPAILKRNSVTVVYVPTNAIGENQVDLLKKKKFNAEYLSPHTRRKLRSTVLKDFTGKTTKLNFLYVSIDKKIAQYVQQLISKLVIENALSFLVFEEAHCISSLSHDYLPAYKEMANNVTSEFPEIRKIALTGTATYKIIENIIHTLAMENVKLIRSTKIWSMCQDIRFIDTLENPLEDLKIFIMKCLRPLKTGFTDDAPYCGIVFCRKKNAVKKLEKEFRDVKIPIVSYYGNLPSKARRSIYERWVAGKIPVIATTHKFGFGLGGPNVRFVVHWGMPLSIQQLCQEAGKCVQDGLRTSSRMYFSIEEFDNIRMYIKSLSVAQGEEFDMAAQKIRFFNQFVDYCFEEKCRATTQLFYFDYRTSQRCLTCDACTDPKGLNHRIKEFLEFHSEIRKTMLCRLESKQIQELRTASLSRSGSNNSSNPFLVRERSYKRLLLELERNNRKTRSEVKDNIESKVISEIARSLEYSVFIGSNSRQKYKHDIIEAIRNIRKSNRAGLTCGYLTRHGEMETFKRQTSPPIIELTDSTSSTETP